MFIHFQRLGFSDRRMFAALKKIYAMTESGIGNTAVRKRGRKLTIAALAKREVVRANGTEDGCNDTVP